MLLQFLDQKPGARRTNELVSGAPYQYRSRISIPPENPDDQRAILAGRADPVRLPGVILFGTGWFIRRSIRRLLDQYWSRPDMDEPALASATEAAVILAREEYNRGEFRRAVVRRVPRDLFGDDLILECGHTTMATRREEDVASADAERR